MKLLMYSKNYNLFLFLFLSSFYFVNTSFIPGSKLPLSFFILSLFFIFHLSFLKNIKIKQDIVILLFFLITLYLSQIMNFGFQFLDKTITQLMNFTFITVMYILFDILLDNIKYKKDDILEKLFNLFSYITILAIFLYIIGLNHPDIIYDLTHLINNSGSFSVGGIISSFGWWGPPRLNTFSPEPSFIAFLIALNIAIGISVKKVNKLLLLINTIALVLTLSRTGFLMFFSLIIFSIYYYSKYTKLIFSLLSSLLLIIIFISVDFNQLLIIDDSFRQRFESVFISYDIFLNNPISGLGLGGFEVYAHNNNNNLDFKDIYNLYFFILVSGGILPLITFFLFLWFILLQTELKYRKIICVIYVGWLTFSAYNLLIIWFIFALLKRREY